MATSRKHTAPAKAQSFKRAAARVPRSGPSAKDRPEFVRRQLVGARAAVITAVQALSGSGVSDAVATSLMRHVLNPIEALLEMTEGDS